MEVDLLVFLGLVALLVAVAATLLGLAIYSGLNYVPEVSSGVPPIQKCQIAYKFLKGSYGGSAVGATFTEVTSIAPKAQIVGIFYDNPQAAEELGTELGGSQDWLEVAELRRLLSDFAKPVPIRPIIPVLNPRPAPIDYCQTCRGPLSGADGCFPICWLMKNPSNFPTLRPTFIDRVSSSRSVAERMGLRSEEPMVLRQLPDGSVNTLIYLATAASARRFAAAYADSAVTARQWVATLEKSATEKDWEAAVKVTQKIGLNLPKCRDAIKFSKKKAKSGKEVLESRLRCAVGCVVSAEGQAPVSEAASAALKDNGFSLMELPGIAASVNSSFPYTTPLSVRLGPARVYPRLAAFIEEKNLCAYPMLEVYEGGEIKYMAPLSQQDAFFVPETEQEEESEPEDLGSEAMEDVEESEASDKPDESSATESDFEQIDAETAKAE